MAEYEEITNAVARQQQQNPSSIGSKLQQQNNLIEQMKLQQVQQTQAALKSTLETKTSEDLTPLAALIDSWTGSKFSQTYKQTFSPAQKKNLAFQYQNLLSKQIKDMGTESQFGIKPSRMFKYQNEAMRAHTGEARGTSHIKRLYKDVQNVDRVLYQMDKDYLTGKRPFDVNAAKDVSAALSSLILGGVPTQTLIDDTTYNSIKGSAAKVEQWVKGKPISFYTPEVLATIYNQSQTYEEVIKHQLSRHHSNVLNRTATLRKADPNFEYTQLNTFGKFAQVNPLTGLWEPNAIDKPFQTIYKTDYKAPIEIKQGKGRPDETWSDDELKAYLSK